ncbi:hypothetical protein P43SY_004404 [Pythium insidiosum]|uniref:Multiple inositol polyphosphate phosphatase 1 n=1 Tax=Pythium insidiosum TaxID=114742 RepID=A0AAD5QEE3_PYTIN|nr:hypothetical protein P43SY_004404 [Pythium insidiosum]
MRLRAIATLLTAVALAGDVAAKRPPFELNKSFGTKTAYWDQSRRETNAIKQFVQELSREEESKYTLVQVQQVVRHGTRFPTDGNMAEIQDLVKRLQANYSSIPKWLQSYQTPYNVSIEGTLAPNGVTELVEFASRTRAAVGNNVLPNSFSAEKFILQHTYKSRTKDSAIAFASKFFSNPSEVKYIEYGKKDDYLLRFYDRCPRYERDVLNNPTALIEVQRFSESPVMQKNVETLRAKLKLPASASLSVKDVASAWSACAFDLALFKRTDNWCTLMTPELVKSVEYLEDLSEFYEESHGYKINYEIASLLLRDIVKYMRDSAEGKTQIVGNFRFAHGETTTPLLTLLGYMDSKKLLASFTPEMIDARRFRMAKAGPFMANIEFRLYNRSVAVNTDGEESPQQQQQQQRPQPTKTTVEKFYVQIRVNEQVTIVPGCDSEIFCELSEFEQIHDFYLHQFDFAAACT